MHRIKSYCKAYKAGISLLETQQCKRRKEVSRPNGKSASSKREKSIEVENPSNSADSKKEREGK